MKGFVCENGCVIHLCGEECTRHHLTFWIKVTSCCIKRSFTVFFESFVMRQTSDPHFSPCSGWGKGLQKEEEEGSGKSHWSMAYVQVFHTSLPLSLPPHCVQSQHTHCRFVQQAVLGVTSNLMRPQELHHYLPSAHKPYVHMCQLQCLCV